jgi:hypothetical protein
LPHSLRLQIPRESILAQARRPIVIPRSQIREAGRSAAKLFKNDF